MPEQKYLTTPPEQDTMPAGVPYIVGNEAAERFSFYGMKAILAVFMTGHLLNAAGEPDLMSTELATKWIHNFVAAVYFIPILGAILADWLFGKYGTILALSIVYCLGHGVLALMDVHTGLDQRTLLMWGLVLIAIGSGGIKPCVTAHVGDQFGKKNSHLFPVVMAWFYFSINFGSMFSTLLTPWLRKEYGPSVAFGVPGVLMVLATIVFWMGRNVFVHVPPARQNFFRETFSSDGLRAMRNLIPLFLFAAMFWALFDQTASRWVLQAKAMNRSLFGFYLSADQLQAVNPLMVLAFIPLFSYFLYPFLGRFFRVTPLRKIGIGMFVVLPSFLIPGWLESQLVYDQAFLPENAQNESYTEESQLSDQSIRMAIQEWDRSSTITRIDVDRRRESPLYTVFSVDSERFRSVNGTLNDLARHFQEKKISGAVRVNVEEVEAPSIGWQILAYAFLTAAELLISITCYEFSYTQAPNNMKSYVMGLYLLFGVALGNKFTALVNDFLDSRREAGHPVLEGPDYYWFFTACMAVTAILYVFWSRTYRGKTYVQSEKYDETYEAEAADAEINA
ncbi:MAG: POT family MFS transporter [Planctomycetaceae bacterium]|nr:POT family MFS transporter [Planctomycetaceae bacterium]